jgi:hypothetical protein
MVGKLKMIKEEYQNKEWYKNAIAFGITEEEIEKHPFDICVMSTNCLPLKKPFEVDEDRKRFIDKLLGKRDMSEKLKLLYFINKLSVNQSWNY